MRFSVMTSCCVAEHVLNNSSKGETGENEPQTRSLKALWMHHSIIVQHAG